MQLASEEIAWHRAAVSSQLERDDGATPVLYSTHLELTGGVPTPL